jgi:iron-sulfur cluster assembly accessory protein
MEALRATLTSRRGALNYPSKVLANAAPGTALAAPDKVAMTETAALDVKVSARAAERIGAILQGEPAGTMLRVSVEGGGCSGFQYKFDIERAKADDDLVLARDGAVVLIDPVSVNYMAGSQIDFVDDLIGQSFKINNPQATASCGCGTSFSV